MTKRQYRSSHFHLEDSKRNHSPSTGSSGFTFRFAHSLAAPPTPPLKEQNIGTTPASVVIRNEADIDPDVPLPSVEPKLFFTSSPDRVPSTSPVTVHDDLTPRTSVEGAVQDQIDALGHLRLSSPDTSEVLPQQRVSTPSICVSPSAPPADEATGNSNLVTSFRALGIGINEATPKLGSPGPHEGSSPSKARGSRSGSRSMHDIHRVEHEEPPRARFHMLEIQKALSDVKIGVSRMVDVLSSSKLYLDNEATVHGLYQRALKLGDQQLPSKRIVGLVGDSGAGKSRLINSLLDRTDLARASGKGAACTCAVTEYVYHDRSDFAIQAEYFTPEELRKQFEELLRAYRDHTQQPEAPKSQDQEEEKEQNTIAKDSEKKANLATHTFSAIFAKELGDNPTVLTSMAFDHAVDMMVEWTSRLVPRSRDQETFITIEQVSSRLRELTSEADSSSTHELPQTRWPLVRKLRVYLNAFVLSKGLIIVDLPGLRDQNSARKAITEQYIRHCHQIFAVARIDRAITDESIQQVFELARCANLTNVDVVCTRSEDVVLSEASNDWVAERGRIKELQSAIAKDTASLIELKEEIKDFPRLEDLTREDQKELLDMQYDRLGLEKSMAKNEFELLRLIIGLRNESVSTKLREQYKQHPIASNAKIFCVGNKLYQAHRNMATRASEPYLSMSGILELRQYCIGIVADSQLRAAVEFVKDQVPAFLASVALWVEAGAGTSSVEKKQRILDAVSAIQDTLDEMGSSRSRTNDISRKLLTGFNEQIETRMLQRSRQWAISAKETSELWHTWNANTYGAYCRNYGDYSTKAKPNRCWNEEAMVHMKRDMTEVWARFVGDQEQNLQQALDSIKDIFESMLRNDMPGNFTGPDVDNISRSMVRTLAEIRDHRKDIVLCGTQNAIEEFRFELLELETDALGSVRTSFIGNIMDYYYHEAILRCGSGCDQRRKRIITRGFGSTQTFNSHRQACNQGFKDIVRSLQDKIDEAISQQVQLIEADLQILKDENVVLESEQDPEFRGRVEAELAQVIRDVERARHVFTSAA